MAGLGFEDLPWPKRRYRVDLLDPEFDTRAENKGEDAMRANRLRSQSAKHGGEWGERASALADRLDPTITPRPPRSLASARHMRKLRIRITGALLKVTESDRTGRVYRYDIIKPSWACDLNEMIDHNPRRMLLSLRADILRKAQLPLRGFLFAAHHNEFDPTTGLFQCHAHILVSGDYIDRIEALRKLRTYRPNPAVRRPIRARRNLADLPHALSYLVKSYIPSRPTLPLGANGADKRPRQGQRLPEPWHSEWLLWADRWSIDDMTLRMGMRVSRDGFRVSNP